MRRMLDWLDSTLGKWFGRALGTLCLVVGAGGILSAVLGWRSRGFGWVFLIPLGAGLVFTGLGIGLWRYKRRLSDYDWTGV
jgi:hypothetical protein